MTDRDTIQVWRHFDYDQDVTVTETLNFSTKCRTERRAHDEYAHRTIRTALERGLTPEDAAKCRRDRGYWRVG